MNEITRIHLGRQPFTIAVDARKDLHIYLQAIKHAVGKSHKEVVEEVELRMAELLVERGVTGEKVVIAEDVAYLKEQLGKPGDFAEDGETSDAAPVTEEGDRAHKRLFRDTEHAAIAGVLAGINAYTGFSLIWLRILYVVLTFVTGGTAILIYMILWLVIPPVRTQSEKLQMHGKPVTVDSLKELVDQADFEGAATRAGEKIEPVAMTILKIALAFVGVLFIIKAVLLWIAAIVAGSFLLVTGVQIDGVHMFPVGVKETLLAGSGLALVIILGAVLFILGMAAMRRKWTVKGWLMGALAGLFILFASVGTALGFSVGPAIADRFDSVRHEKVLSQPEFKQLHVIGDDSYITYEQGDRYAVELHYLGDKNRDLSQIAQVKDGVLTLDMTKADDKKRCDFWCIDAEDIRVKVYSPSLQSLRADGDAYVSVDRAINQDSLTITVNGDSNVNLHGVQIDKVAIQDQRDKGYLQLVATGIRDNHSPYPVGPAVSMDAGQINLGDVEEVAVTTTARGCEEREHFVSTELLPKVLRINDEQVDPLQLSHLSGEREFSPYHCVVLEEN